MREHSSRIIIGSGQSKDSIAGQYTFTPFYTVNFAKRDTINRWIRAREYWLNFI